MRIELLYFDGCPAYRNTEEDLRRILAEEGVEAEVKLVEVNSDEEARRLGFPGSPTVRIDGRDPFPVPERGARCLACRVYATPEGMKGTPTAAMIREALGSGDEEPLEREPLTPADEEPGELGGVFGLPFRTLLSREVRRFVRVWTQTLLAPLLTSALYILVFGYGLGSRIREAAGVPYLEFILPGLVLMSVITASYGNTSTSLFDAKRDRYIDDMLISPMTALQMALAFVLGGVARGLLVGAGTFALAIPLAGLPAKHPLLLIVTALAASVIFASLGVVAGVLTRLRADVHFDSGARDRADAQDLQRGAGRCLLALLDGAAFSGCDFVAVYGDPGGESRTVRRALLGYDAVGRPQAVRLQGLLQQRLPVAQFVGVYLGGVEDLVNRAHYQVTVYQVGRSDYRLDGIGYDRVVYHGTLDHLLEALGPAYRRQERLTHQMGPDTRQITLQELRIPVEHELRHPAVQDRIPQELQPTIRVVGIGDARVGEGALA